MQKVAINIDDCGSMRVIAVERQLLTLMLVVPEYLKPHSLFRGFEGNGRNEATGELIFSQGAPCEQLAYYYHSHGQGLISF